jgi:hypothetical protein
VVICYLGWDDGTFLVSKVESIGCDYYENHYEKKVVLTLALRLNLWVALDIYNSLYLYDVSANGQIALVAKLQLTIFMV